MIRILLTVTALLGACLAPAYAAEVKADYDLKIRGFTVGALSMVSAFAGRSYTVSSVIENTGFSRIFRHFSYRGAARGVVRGSEFRPDYYQESADTGRRQSEVVLVYANGVPTVQSYSSPNPVGADSPDPATQGGTIDPLSSILAMLRDVPRNRACDLDATVFDGKRRSRIAMGPMEHAGTVPKCVGIYQRLEGFTAKETTRHKQFNFVLTYGDSGNGMLRVESVAFDSFYGTATIIRR